MEEKRMSQAMFDFLGFKLTGVKYINTGEKDNTYISIDILDEEYTNDNIYSILVKIGTDFDKTEDYFIFEAAFAIKDKNWFLKLSESEKKYIFLNVVFPFIREKVFSITSDINQGLLIPVIDLKEFDLSKEIKLVKNN